MKLLFHPETEKQLNKYLINPTHALLLQGPVGSGKTTTLNWLAANLLETDTKDINTHPYFLRVAPDEKKLISIETIRTINHFLGVKVPSSKQGINRVVLIDNAEFMSEQAQNALLKNLEEPPDKTVLLISTSNPNKILLTIKSRSTLIRLNQPIKKDLENYFQDNGLDKKTIDRAINISGGITGLAIAIAEDSDNHPLIRAAVITRLILASSRYERLLKVNELYKDREIILDILMVMQHMAKLALETADNLHSIRWNNILKQTYLTEQQLNHHANTKLTLTNFMLNL